MFFWWQNKVLILIFYSTTIQATVFFSTPYNKLQKLLNKTPRIEHIFTDTHAIVLDIPRNVKMSLSQMKEAISKEDSKQPTHPQINSDLIYNIYKDQNMLSTISPEIPMLYNIIMQDYSRNFYEIRLYGETILTNHDIEEDTKSSTVQNTNALGTTIAKKFYFQIMQLLETVGGSRILKEKVPQFIHLVLASRTQTFDADIVMAIFNKIRPEILLSNSYPSIFSSSVSDNRIFIDVHKNGISTSSHQIFDVYIYEEKVANICAIRTMNFNFQEPLYDTEEVIIQLCH